MKSHIHVTRRRLLTPKQAARMLNVQENTLANWCERGLIAADAYESGAPARFVESEVNRLSTMLRSNNEQREDLQPRKTRFALWS